LEAQWFVKSGDRCPMRLKMHSERITIISFLTFGRFPAACCRDLQKDKSMGKIVKKLKVELVKFKIYPVKSA
jgi:hypothetical protein